MKSTLLSLLIVSPAMAQMAFEKAMAPPTPPAIEYRLATQIVPPPPPDFTTQTTLYSIGAPTEEEQYYLELINRARANPTAEGLMLATTTHPSVLSAIAQFGVDLDLMKTEFTALPVRPPLAMNALLTNAARGHTQYQFDNAIQDHTGSGGSSPGTRAAAAGYSGGVAESVFSYAKDVFHGHAGFQIDWGPGGAGGMQLGRGHRMNNHGNYREVGIGVILGSNTVAGNTVGPQLVTQNFATPTVNTQAFVTGVAYYDLNANNLFDPGEGIGGLTVNVNGSTFHAVTATTGGYAVPVPTTNATRAVTFTGLGANGGDDAVISGGANVKVDFKPAYTPASLTGPDAASTLAATNYTFNTVIGATGYKGRSVANANAANDGADNTSRVTVAQTGTYAITFTDFKDSGTGCYHLAHPTFVDQTLTYAGGFHVKTGGAVSFRSRLGWAGAQQAARVEISTNGGNTWESVFSQTGTGTAGETSFNTRNANLTAYVGKDVLLRFNYSVGSGGFPQTDAGVGWYIDTITFTNLVDLTNATVTTLPAGTTFAYTAPVVGNFLLSVSPIISGRDFGFGPVKAVTASAAPPSLAEITVEQPATNELTDGADTVAFGTKMLNDAEVKTFVIRNDGTEDLTGLALSVIGAHPGDFVAADLGDTTLIPGNDTTFTVTFTAENQGARTATLRIASNDSNENPFDINLTGTASNAPTIDVPPVSLVRIEGTTAEFTVAASHPTLAPTFQWRKNGVAIKNATTDTLTFAAVKPTDAANYTVVVSAGGESVTSDAVVLATIKPVNQLLVVAQGTTLKPTVTVTGAATLTWSKTHGDPPVMDDLGPLGKTLVLTSLSAATGSGIYQCEASVPGGSALPAGVFDIRVFSAKPQVTSAQNMPDGAVGIPYTHQILLNGGLDESPVSYAAKNLPTGLTLNTKTGFISGVPTVAKTFLKVSVSATNSKGSTASAEQSIIIDPLPGGVMGTFTGTVAREATLNGGLGGRVDLTIASTGAISGSMMLGATKLPFKSAIVIDANPLVAPSAFINVPRGVGKIPYFFVLTLDTANDSFAAGTNVNDGLNNAAIEGWRHVWNTLNLATATPKLFTYALRPPALPAEMPRGDGYGSFTLAKDGKLTTAGKLADGEGYTNATYAGPHGQILLFQVLTTTKGSILGTLDIDATNDGLLDDDGLTGTVSWSRPLNAKSRVYPAGFGPVDLTAVGARFTPPVAPDLVLDLIVGVDKAKLNFADGGLAGSVIDPNVDEFDIIKGNKPVLPPLLSTGNPGSVKITALSATTGFFTGTFVVEDDEIRTGTFTGKKIKRTATFNGILTHDGTAKIGAGHFLLAELPHDADPGALPPIKATTPTTSLMLSGSVLLEKK
jgi:hypothetical protein